MKNIFSASALSSQVKKVYVHVSVIVGYRLVQICPPPLAMTPT